MLKVGVEMKRKLGSLNRSKSKFQIIIGSIILIAGVFLLVKSFSGNSKDRNTVTSESSSAIIESSISKEKFPETVKFDVDGKYYGESDINVGTYIMVLTEYEKADRDTEDLGYVYCKVTKNDIGSEYLKTVGKATKVKINKDTVIIFDSEYDPSFEVTFFTEDEYINYKDSIEDTSPSQTENSLAKESSETTGSTSEQTSEIKSSSSSSESTTTSTDKLYSDERISITRNGSELLIHNNTNQKLNFEGKAYLNNTYEISEYSFGNFAYLQPYGEIHAHFEKIELMEPIDDGDTESDVKFWGNTTYDHTTKNGEKLTWVGELQDENKNRLSQFTLEIYV